MKMLILPRYGRMGASSRMRLYQYLPWLEAAGIDVHVSPLFSDFYVQDLQRNSKNPLGIFRAYIARIKTLLARKEFDLIWIEKEVLPWLPAWLENVLLSGKVPYFLDYDDAVFHYYDLHGNPFVRLLLGRKHASLISGAAMVVAGNKYLANFAQQSGSVRLEVFPTVINLERYPLYLVGFTKKNPVPLRVGWIGQRSTAKFLMPYKSLFERLSASGKVKFVAIGINASLFCLPMDSIPWTEENEVVSIAGLDIGIMPLADEPFERGKCGYKLIQYMACSLPVVASPVGVNSQIVEHGVNGFLADTPEEWDKYLKTLLLDTDLRIRMGRAGRRKVEQHYCIQKTGPILAKIILTSLNIAKKG